MASERAKLDSQNSVASWLPLVSCPGVFMQAFVKLSCHMSPFGRNDILKGLVI